MDHYSPRTAPRGHQLEALRRVATRPDRPSDEDAFAWLMEMGTGKSKVVVDEWGARVAAGELRDLLVVAPAGAYRNWWRVDPSWEDPGEVQKHLSPELWERVHLNAWVSGAGKVHRQRLAGMLALADRPRVLVVNCEALSSVAAAYELCEEFLGSGKAMMVVDESTCVKNPSALRTRRVLRLGGLAAARRIATGLVAPRSPLDLFSQFQFLDWRIIGCKTIWGYRARYAVEREMEHGGRRFKIVVGFRPGAQDELRERVAPYSYRVLKEDCLDLEPKVYRRRDVELTDEQRRIYRDLKGRATAEIEDGLHVTATEKMTQLVRLDQVACGFVVDEEGRAHDLPERRTDGVLEVLGEHGGKAVVWTAYDRTLRKLVRKIGEEFGEGSVAAFWGGNRGTRGEDEERFKGDPACRFMVATAAAGGRGNTWVGADLNVYHSNTFDLEQRSQSEDRTHRHGQSRSVTYVDMVAPGTVDERKLRALRAKIDVAAALSGDGYREWLV